MTYEVADRSQITGPQKAALLLVRMGREHAAAVLRNMSEEDAADILSEVAALPVVRTDVTDSVLEEAALRMRQVGAYGSSGLAVSLASEAFGEERALELAPRLAGEERRPTAFPFLAGVPAETVAEYLADEHPQTVALVLVNLGPGMSSEVFSRLPDHLQRDTSVRVCTMRNPSSEMVEVAERSLQKKMAAALEQSAAQAVGGVDSLVTLLSRSDKDVERTVLGELERIDPALAAEVRSKLFTFDHIAELDKRDIQRILRDVSQDDLVLALKGASDEVVDAVKSNMSSNAVEILTDEMAVMGAVRVADAQAARERVLAVVRELEEEGVITIQRSGEQFVA